MDAEKRRRLEGAGWTVGNADDFLGKDGMEETRLSHAERRERRREIAEFMKEHKDTQKAVAHFGCTLSLVSRACKEFGVDVPKTASVATVGSFVILKRLLDGAKQIEVAGERGISRERVRQVANNAREAGFAV